jgi:hypothetical protein
MDCFRLRSLSFGGQVASLAMTVTVLDVLPKAKRPAPPARAFFVVGRVDQNTREKIT